MDAEIIAVGTELLLGEVLNSNAQFMSRECARLGINVFHHVTVGDNWERLRQALDQARHRVDLVLVCGGLGPTPDDITRQVVADVWNRPLYTDDQLAIGLKTYFCNRGVEMTANNNSQAQLPQGALVLANPRGTAPGFYLQDECADVACLPGPPNELEPMFLQEVVPLMNRLGLLPGTQLYSRDILTAGIGESTLATQIDDLIAEQGNPSIATYAGGGRVRVRLTARAASVQEAEQLFAPVQEKLQQRFQQYIYGFDQDTLAGVLGMQLAESACTLGVAESCTGGLLAEMITEVPGSSRYFQGGLITYSDASKAELLGVAPELIRAHGAVSRPVAEAMARGVRERLESTIAVSITGVAGPDGGTEEKPVGTVCFGFLGPWGVQSERQYFTGSRSGIRQRSAIYALARLRQLLQESKVNPPEA